MGLASDLRPHSLIGRFGYIEVVIESILHSDFVEMLSHLLAPPVNHSLSQSWKTRAACKLGHEFFTMLPFIKCLDLYYLSRGSVLSQVEECWSVSDLAQVGQFVFLLHLEEWHLV